ncbi:MAG: RagB/SusD family nutrient uptake outer membrane protein [Bacteroidota bacterium]
MKVRRISKLIIAGFFCTLFNACDVLDVEPESQISGEQFWQSNADLETGIAAIYDALQTALRTNYWHWGEARSDNFGLTEKPGVNANQLLFNALDPTAPSAEWQQLYRVISFANLAIENGERLSNADPDLLGEAYALRAFAYFYAIRIWGDVPLFTEAITNLDQELIKGQTSSTVIFDQVILPDLQKAQELITSQSRHTRLSRGGVLALLAHAYMWDDNPDEAINVITDLENLNEYDLAEDRDEWVNMFLDDAGSELIFSLKWQLDEDGNSQAQSMLNDGSPEYIYSSTLLEKWLTSFPNDSVTWAALYPDFIDGREEFGDWRMFESINFLPLPWDRDNFRTTLKYLKQIGMDDNRDLDDRDYPIFRFAGILLLKAEAYALSGNRDQAIDYLNRIRAARELPTFDGDELSINSLSKLLNTILDERQFELYAEGHRWFDLRRNNKVLEVLGPINGFTDEGRFLWPVSLEAMERNSKLIQNEAYR